MLKPMRLIATAPRQLHWEPLPLSAPSAGELLVRTRYSAVSVSSELSQIAAGPFPRQIGYQTLGMVEAVGPQVALSAGQRVVTMQDIIWNVTDGDGLTPDDLATLQSW